ncbi:MAG: hypothetical protein JRJ77_16410 [Deltaproteobacteria bacterium]|nr:hypothetical protein [Deltaproteobacteria bacterium]
MTESEASIRWNLERISELLQGTKVVSIKGGTYESWEDILLSHLPDSIEEVEIYDRFIRNVYQFKSLEMLLDAVGQKAAKGGMSVRITTTASPTSEGYERIQNDFKRIQEDYAKRGVQIEYRILEPDKTLPHFRRIIIKSKNGNSTIWLDRGIDIFRFEALKPPKFITLDSYIVIETGS